MKLKSKEREDTRRGARKCQLKPGDTVIVERQSRAKGDSRFGVQRYTVMEERNGRLVLGDDGGRTIKRHVSQTKQVFEWRDQLASKDTLKQNLEDGNPIQRAPRNRRAPSHLQDFVRMADGEV